LKLDSATWDKLFAHLRKETFAADGYTIEFWYSGGVRYRSKGKAITISRDPIPRRADNRWWTIFTGYYAIYYLEVPVSWDNEEEPMSVGEAETVTERITEYLDRRLGRGKYRISLGTETDQGFHIEHGYKGYGRIF
jgi:hypothetical protein